MIKISVSSQLIERPSFARLMVHQDVYSCLDHFGFISVATIASANRFAFCTASPVIVFMLHGNDHAACMKNWCLFLISVTPTDVCFLPVCVLNLQSDGEVVTDTNPHLASCCELIELVLRKGLQRQYPLKNITF